MITGPVYQMGGEVSGTSLVKLFHSVVPPFCRPYQEHRHTAFELSLICQGHGLYQTGLQQYPFQPGDVFLFSTNEPHCIMEIFDGPPLDILNLHFEPRLLWSPEEHLPQLQYPDVFFSRNRRYLHCLSQKPGPTHLLTRKLLEIEAEFRRQEPDYTLMVKLHILSILVLIRREYGECFTHTSQPADSGCLPQLQRALRYIDHNLAQPLTLDSVARQAAMSPSYFSSLFKKWNGMTLWEYIQTRRIETAAERVASTGKNISAIALECGYNSLSNFNRSFKRITGQTPGEYRKNNSLT